MPFFPFQDANLRDTVISSLVFGPEKRMEKSNLVSATLTAQQTQTKNQQVEIEYKDLELDAETGIATYRGGVVVRFKSMILKTETLVLRDTDSGPETVDFRDGSRTLSLKRKEAYAIGKVEISDPDINLSVSEVWFSFDEKNKPTDSVARAKNFYSKVDTAWIRAESAELIGSVWFLKNLSFSTSDRKNPYYQVNARELVFEPGKKGTARRVRFEILGSSLPTIPSATFSLDQRRRATQLPQLSVRQREGIGFSWGGNFELGPNEQLTTNVASFPRIIPTYDLQVAFSRVPARESGFNQLRSMDDFGERSMFSYFGNIFVNSIQNPKEIMDVKRNLFTVGTAVNVGTFGRTTDFQKTYTRFFDAVLERGGKQGNWATFFQTRAQYVGEQGGDRTPRLATTASFASPISEYGRLKIGARFDVAGFLDRNNHAWFGGEGGISYSANRFLDLSIGAYGYQNLGTPFFAGDQFQSNQGLVLRSDIKGKATNFSILFRYDPSQGWFDRQYRFTQVVGPVEPVIIYRASPNFYQIGLNFRIDNILGILQNRSKKSN
jgi:hypothetical protein